MSASSSEVKTLVTEPISKTVSPLSSGTIRPAARAAHDDSPSLGGDDADDDAGVAALDIDALDEDVANAVVCRERETQAARPLAQPGTRHARTITATNVTGSW